MEIDVEIINRVKKGNSEAYGIIVKKYMKKAYFLVLGFVGDTNDALDLSQMAFFKALVDLSGPTVCCFWCALSDGPNS